MSEVLARSVLRLCVSSGSSHGSVSRDAGNDSPVTVALFTRTLNASTRRQSAGRLSPASSRITSPGTNWAAGTCRTRPSARPYAGEPVGTLWWMPNFRIAKKNPTLLAANDRHGELISSKPRRDWERVRNAADRGRRPLLRAAQRSGSLDHLSSVRYGRAADPLAFCNSWFMLDSHAGGSLISKQKTVLVEALAKRQRDCRVINNLRKHGRSHRRSSGVKRS